MLFGRKKKAEPKATYNATLQKAVIRCSICNGEQVAGFKDIEAGKFSEVMLIRNEKDLELFKMQYGITEVIKEY